MNIHKDGVHPPHRLPCICHEMVWSYLNMTPPPSLAGAVVLDLGCGPTKLKGSTGLDVRPFVGVDVVCDHDAPIWPIRDHCADAVWSNQLIEHLDDVVAFLDRLHVCVRMGAEIVLLAPHYSSTYAWSDPTHRRGVAIVSLDYACSYLPRKYAVVHRFFGVPTGHRGLKSLIVAAINKSLSRQLAYERWVTPVLSGGLVGFHLRS